MKINSYIIDTFEGFKDLSEYELSVRNGCMFFDLETDSKIEKLAKIHGIGLTFKDNEGFYIQIRNSDRNLIWDTKELNEIFAWVGRVAHSRGIIGWNLLYDVLVWENNTGQDIVDCIYSDGILLKHTISEEGPFGLKEVAVKYLGEWADKAQDALYASIEKNGGSTTKDNLEMFKADRDVLAEYCVHDCVLTFKLFHMFQKILIKEGLAQLFYDDEVMPLYKLVTIPMKRKGFRIDVPHFKQLQRDIGEDIANLEADISDTLLDYTEEYIVALLDKKYPIKRAGKYPKILAQSLGVELPKVDGKITLGKKALASINVEFRSWMEGAEPYSQEIHKMAQVQWFFNDNPEQDTIFNLKSNDHLIWLFFEKLGEKPLHKTPGGSPQCDDDFLDSLKDKYSFVPKLIEYKKLIKLSSTYIDGILDRSIDGYIYPSFLQFGTISGRYSCTGPNLQNQPRQKEDEEALTPMILKYTNAIRRGFIADEGGVLVDLDQSQLEPRAFATASGDPALQSIFKNKIGFYEGIAKSVFKLPCEASEIKAKYPVHRQTSKTIALATTYGAEEHRIAGLLNISTKEAKDIIDAYMGAYPDLKKFIARCHYEAKTTGQVKTMFGRVRHLGMTKYLYEKYGDSLLNFHWARKNGLTKERKLYKNGLNNSTNFKIQGLAAHIMNRSCIALARQLKSRHIDATIIGQIHDQIILATRKEDEAEVMMLAQLCLENTVALSVPLVAVPSSAQNLAESH